ncbi:quorum-sensing sensor histidine kinase AgrC [Staphylococcus sp. 17KM0847]|uniref:quorum-sensing sensor histidine kinase AgrC n=1 Tax=Staphylococcus sp. 17KM0847 TaxID=2583989 RepID=UPI0015DCFFFC|nr:GHKL domain-containing protein [Staphylococcus sp. 17KM0847]
MEIIYIVVLTLFQVFVLFTVTNLILVDKPKYTRRDYLSIIIGIVVPSTVLFLYFGNATLFFLILCFFIFFYKKKRMIGIISILMSVLILILSDFLATLLHGYLSSRNINFYLNQAIYVFIFVVGCFLFAILFRYLMRLLKFSWLYVNKLYLFLLATMLTVFFILIDIFKPTKIHSIEDMKAIALVVIVYFIAFAILVIMISITASREITYRRNKQEIEDYYKYTLQIEQINNRMRKFRHDYINILSSMSEYLREDDLEGLKSYYYTHISPLKDNFEHNSLKLNGVEKLRLREIKGVMTTKILQAQENDIEVSVEVADEITHINMPLIDLSRVLGIIMDNAIEASLTIDDPMIQIAFIKTDTSVLIIIMNKAPDNLPKLHTLFQEGFSTKGQNRGLGLSTLKEITDNTDNALLDTTINNHYFIQKLEIMNDNT